MHILFLSLMQYAWLCVSHMHREQQAAGRIILCSVERVVFTPDTNGPPSFLCMKNQLMNVTRE